MRSHRKLAVLKDDEVDRLERASKAAVGDSREDIMDSMYGKLNPKPAGGHPSIVACRLSWVLKRPTMALVTMQNEARTSATS